MSDILKRGSKGEEVTALQTELNALGCTVDVDGHFGPATEQAVMHLQRAFGLDADGIVGKVTRAKISEQLASDSSGNA